MVFQKWSDCVSNGYQIPAMPRVPRSAKRKRSARKKIEDNQMCAFDLLATIAGKILSEKKGFCAPSKVVGVTSTVYSNIQEQLGSESPFNVGVFDQGSCDESTFAFPFVSDEKISHTTKQNLKSLEGSIVPYAPAALAKSDGSENDASCNVFANGAKGECPYKLLCSTSGPLIYDDSTRICTLVDPIDLDRKPPVIVSSASSIEITSYGDCSKAHSNSFPSIREGMELHVDRDDEENSSGSTHPKDVKAHCTEEHRRRKMMKSNNRNADPVSYNNGLLSNDDVEMKPFFRGKRLFYTQKKSQRGSPKRRKLFNRCSVSRSCGSSRNEVKLDSPVKGANRLEATSDVLVALNGANNVSCSRRGQNSLYESEDHSVKLSIKSFKVPELFIEMPANATVGILKRTVMEAVMAIFEDGLRVGVLLQGKKVRDDNKTLHQAGISYEHKIDGLGFTLEPNTTRTPPPRHSIKETASIPSDPPPPNKSSPILIQTKNCIESDNENSLQSPIDRQPIFPFRLASDSQAVVHTPAVNPEALSIIRIRKSRQSDIPQRRIRRPFSVCEVEALVQAVEKLGTGRWRDVKLRAFDKSKHRTYVDLKDKWKTLVHTAKISPQQRRGEPVPQELLDRVLSAHSYWSHQQANISGPAHSSILA